MVEMFDKLLTRLERHAQSQLDESLKKQRTSLRTSLAMLKSLGEILLDETIADQQIRSAVFGQFPRQMLEKEMLDLDDWLNGKHSESFPLVMQRFGYLRQFAPSLLDHVTVRSESAGNEPLLQAIDLLRHLNADGKRKIPGDAPLGFIPARLRPFIESDGQFECALLTSLRDEIKRGNLWVPHSKRFGRLNAFFIAAEEWAAMRTAFFHRAGLPCQADDVGPYLTERLNKAFDQFLRSLPSNAYVEMKKEEGWRLGSDRAAVPTAPSEQELTALESWLATRMRTI